MIIYGIPNTGALQKSPGIGIVLQERIKVDRLRICQENQIIDFSYLNIFDYFKATRQVEWWKELEQFYPIPPYLTLENKRPKKNLSHDQNRSIQDDLAKVHSGRPLQDSDEIYEPSKKNSLNVLIVDDDRDILFTFKSILTVAGYNVEAFTDPNEALSHFKQRDRSYYDLIVTDIRMPKINGFQLYQKLKELKTDIRVVFTTAFEVPGNMLDATPDVKGSDIIKKPIEEDLFVNKIKTAINS
jgi:CheY-like chemotaxis protein